MPVLVVKRSDTDNHLVDQDTESPPVNGEVMACLADHLGRKVFWCPTVALGELITLAQNFGKAIVYDFNVADIINHDVFQLEISMHNTFLVEFSDSQCNLYSVELDNVLGKALLFLENLVQLTTTDERHYKVESGV